ncbi:MAG: response regulator [Desulfobacterales bacterium]|nr:response regulator [Desulfobacterales bacterium]
MKKSVILCVDDEISVLTSLRDQLLHFFGDTYQIELAESAEEALEVLEEISQEGKEVPLIISDQIMPGIKGDELLITIHERYPKALKIFLTGQATIYEIGNVVNKASLQAFITKPWDEASIKLIVTKSLHSYFLDKQVNEYRKSLIKANQELEEKIKERTQDLEKAKKELERALEQAQLAQEVAESANKAKSAFLANMSHELRTPLNAIIGFAELALRAETNPKQRDYLTRIEVSSQALLEIICDILDLSKIEAGHLQLECTDFVLEEIVEQIVNIFSVNARKKGVQLILEPITYEIGILKGDPLRLKQVLINLVSNALKFTIKGKITIRSELIQKTEDNVVIEFEVKDTGIGIPKEKMSILFKAFTQVDSSTTRKYGGTGLGLAISKKLVEMMNGCFEFDSEEGKGSIFKFTVEFGHKEYVFKNISKTNAGDVDYGMGMALKGIRVLIVEDNAFNRFLANEILRDMGAIVEEVENGAQALEVLVTKGKAYNAILMDVQLPDMDGLEVTRRIRMNEGLKTVPIIAITACAMQGDKERCIASGMNDYITKPMHVNQVYQVLKKWVPMS